MRMVRASGWAALALAVAAALAVQLPLAPAFIDAQLDASFAAVLNHAAAQPLAQRPRLISTYGPLGYTHYSLYLPETFARVLMVRAALAAVLAWAIAWIGWAVWRAPWGAALAVFACAPLLGRADARVLLLLAAVPLLALAPGGAAPVSLRLALGAALGLLGLTKVTFMTGALAVLAVLALPALLARRAPTMALTALGTAAAGWAVLGLGGADLAAYLDWSLREITPGYTAAMQWRTATALVVHAAAVSAALLVWGFVLAWRGRRPGWWAVPVALAAVLLLQFKAGFVRADVHVFTTAFALLGEGVLLAVLGGRRPAGLALGALLLAVLPGALLWHALVVNGRPDVGFVWPRAIAERLATVPAVARSDAFASAHAQRVRDLAGMMPMPAFAGGVDMIGHWQALLLANQAPYRPRPVFQGYMAYTPRLAAANAAYLSGTEAPRWLLFHPETIDGRLPTIDDAALWPLLLGAYRPAGSVGRYALLERRARPRRWRLLPLGEVDAQTDAPIAVPPPDGGPIWARIDVRDTPAERLQAVLFAAPYVFVDVVFTTNAVWRARVVPAVAADGFLLSPVVDNVAGFVALSERGPAALADKTVRAIGVHVDSPFGGRAAPRPVRVTFARLVLE